MKTRTRLFLPFLLTLFLLFILFFLFKLPVFASLRGGIEDVFHPFQKIVAGIALRANGKSEVDRLKQANTDLLVKLVHLQELEKDNQALRDQFQATGDNPQHILPAKIIGLQPFMPGILTPEYILLDQGTDSHVKVGQVVLSKNFFVGTVISVSPNSAKVQLATNKAVSFTAKTSKTDAKGIFRGMGNGDMIFDKVVLTDKLEKGDVVVTAGNTDMQNSTIPEGYIIGKITSIDKKASSLFQTAGLDPLFDITKVAAVFILTQ